MNTEHNQSIPEVDINRIKESAKTIQMYVRFITSELKYLESVLNHNNSEDE